MKSGQPYPHKVGKRYALACYKAAIKRGCKHGEILFGVHHYVATKPPDRPWLNLSTFLNQERWKDVPAPVKGKIKSLGESFIEAAMKERQGKPSFRWSTTMHKSELLMRLRSCSQASRTLSRWTLRLRGKPTAVRCRPSKTGQ